MFDLVNVSGISWLLYISLLWVLPLKGVALWKAANAKDKPWFVAVFLINTLGILEIMYIFVFAKNRHKGILKKLKIK